MITCNSCGSNRVARFRLDEDWAYGSGDFLAVNDDSVYTEEDKKQYLDQNVHPDIECFVCLSCTRCFDTE